MKLQIVEDDGKVRNEIELNDSNVLVVYNGHDGVEVDDSMMGYLRIDDKNVINQGQFKGICGKLINKYRGLLQKVYPEFLLFLVDTDWEPSEKASKNSAWKIDIQRAPFWARMLTNKDYIIKLRTHWIERWTEAQLAAAIMSQLLRINPEDGSITRYSEDSTSKLIATFGAGYLEPQTIIPDLLTEDVSLREFRRADGQMRMDELPDTGADETGEADDGDAA